MTADLLWLALGFYATVGLAAGGIWLITLWGRDVRAAKREREQAERDQVPVA